MSTYSHPMSSKIINPYIDILVGCFCYLALSFCGQFSGAQMNPSITLAQVYLRNNKFLKSYLFGQTIGAIIGILMGTFIVIEPIS